MEDVDNLNPYFKHNLYRASIAENEVRPWSPLVKLTALKMMSTCIKGTSVSGPLLDCHNRKSKREKRKA